MSNIKQYTDKIRNAIYGIEVRESLAIGIDKINQEVENNTTLVTNTSKDIKNYKDSTSKDITNFKNTTNNDLKTFKENTLKNIDDYKNTSTNSIKKYCDDFVKNEQLRINNENIRIKNEQLREKLNNDLLSLQENYNKAVKATSSLEVIEARQGKDTLNDNIKDIKNDIDSLQTGFNSLSNDFAPLNDFNKMKDQMTKNKPIIITDDTPVGTVIWYTEIPNNIDSTQWKICDGRDLKKSEYHDLFQVIQYRYGGSGDTFKVPDLLTQSLFVRGTNRSGSNVGQIQEDTIKSHTHSIARQITTSSDASKYDSHTAVVNETIGDRKAWSSETGTFGGSETRPRNISFIPIIKAKSRGKDMINIAQEVERAKGLDNSLLDAMNKKLELKDFQINNNENGYIKLPRGLLLQWGKKQVKLKNGEGVAEGSLPLKFNKTLGIYSNIELVDGNPQYSIIFNSKGKFVNNGYFNIRVKNIQSNTGTTIDLTYFALGFY